MVHMGSSDITHVADLSEWFRSAFPATVYDIDAGMGVSYHGRTGRGGQKTLTVLVTGASGFLGGALARERVRRGECVRILARRTSDLRRLQHLPVDVAYGCLDDRASLGPALQGVSIVYHCAALVTDWAPWKTFYGANVLGVSNMLDAARSTGSVRRFVHVSTSDVYGYPVQAADESHPVVLTRLPYQRSKSLGERAVWAFVEQTGLPATVVRPASIYGPGVTEIVTEIANLLLKRQMVLIDSGRCRAGLLYLSNAVDGIILAAHSPHTVGKAYNLRDETDETWDDYVGALAEGLGTRRPWINMPGSVALALGHLFEAMYRALSVRSRPLFTRHAVYVLMRDQGYPIMRGQRDFGFRSEVSFAQGMRQTVAWLDSEEGRVFAPRRPGI